jgi:hypothetical protein
MERCDDEKEVCCRATEVASRGVRLDMEGFCPKLCRKKKERVQLRGCISVFGAGKDGGGGRVGEQHVRSQLSARFVEVKISMTFGALASLGCRTSLSRLVSRVPGEDVSYDILSTHTIQSWSCLL